jgi:hypothetical protein
MSNQKRNIVFNSTHRKAQPIDIYKYKKEDQRNEKITDIQRKKERERERDK